MSRSKLIKHVYAAASAAELSPSETAELVEAVSDPEIKVVAWGEFVLDHKNLFCPVALANLRRGQRYLTQDFYGFWGEFDRRIGSIFFKHFQGIGPNTIKVTD